MRCDAAPRAGRRTAPPAESAPCHPRRRDATCPPRSAARAASRRAAASPAGPGRAASGSTACTWAPAARTRQSAHSDRKPLRSSPVRHRMHRVRARTGADRARTSLTNCSRSCERIHHRCPGSTCCSRSHSAGSHTAGAPGRSPPDSSRPSSSHCGAAQVGACTPLVIEPIGTSDGSKPGHSSLNISRLTRPCSSETPLARCASRRPMWAMLNFDGSSSAPNAMTRSSGTPGSSREVAPDGPPSPLPK